MSTMPYAKPQSKLISQRLLECVGLFMIGDGLFTFAQPRRHVRLWQEGSETWESLMEPLAEHPKCTRWLSAPWKPRWASGWPPGRRDRAIVAFRSAKLRRVVPSA